MLPRKVHASAIFPFWNGGKMRRQRRSIASVCAATNARMNEDRNDDDDNKRRPIRSGNRKLLCRFVIIATVVIVWHLSKRRRRAFSNGWVLYLHSQHASACTNFRVQKYRNPCRISSAYFFGEHCLLRCHRAFSYTIVYQIIGNIRVFVRITVRCVQSTNNREIP